MIERYSNHEMSSLWTDENRFKIWLEIEILSCEAWCELGVIPKKEAQSIRNNANFCKKRIAEIEKETHHDLIAFTRSVSETLNEERKWIHYGLTSTDVIDTAYGFLLKQANQIIERDLLSFIDILKDKAIKYKDTPMMGRTHGIHAEPTSFGVKLALWLEEMKRNLKRFRFAREDVEVGKISGAVGTYANIDPFIETYVCQKLEIKPALISSQTLQRDRHAAYMATLALIATSLDKFATEIRSLQRSEIREVEEPFANGQKGSSAMPHKRNPIGSENISGLSRVLRGQMVSAYENVSLWHERDISHSSVERIILPDATILLNYMLNRLGSIIRNLTVFPENMKKNMSLSFEVPFSGRVMTKLIDKGFSREESYDKIQPLAMKAWEEKRSFKEIVQKSPFINEVLSLKEIDDCFDPKWYLKHVNTIFDRLGLNQ